MKYKINDGKELAERIKADLAEIHHRFEISDSRYDAKYRFYTGGSSHGHGR